MKMQMNQLVHTGNDVRYMGKWFLLMAVLLALLVGGQGITFAAGGSAGSVYVMSNAAVGNSVLVFDRAASGTLTPAGEFMTGGLGSGSGLGSQGALVLSDDQQSLFVVNAGSNEVSIFSVTSNGLSLSDTIASGGELPLSLTVSGNLLYVLNGGGSGNITGFIVANDGTLSPISDSTRNLSNDGVGAAPGPAQISFTPDGRQLIVTEKATNLIVTYQVGQDGRPSTATAHASEGATPFGFDFSKRNTLIVAEAFGGAAGASTASSYAVNSGNLQTVSATVATQQTAACWLVVSGNSKYAYTTNTGSSTVTGYAVANDGSLSLLNADGVTGYTTPGGRPIDASFSRNSQYLYVLSGGTNTVTAFQVSADGSLTSLGDVNVPAGSVGIAAQ
jgi:6-phosphogluconolactonase (cycloisomerase 2 family)